MIDKDTSLITLGELTQPVTRLLDHIATAVGVLYEPTRITRKAKASAKALILRKEAELVARSIEERALTRAQLVEIRRQYNIESIISKTVPLIEPDANPELHITADWLTEFFRIAQDISEEEVQILWSKVLANSSNGKSRYSFRSLDILKKLDPRVAQSFQKFAAATTANQDGIFFFLSYDVADDAICETLLEYAELTDAQIEDLISAGLVVATPFHRLLTNTRLEYRFGELTIKLRLAKRHFVEFLRLFDVYRFTSEGLELSSLTNTHTNRDYIEYVDSVLRGCGLFYEPSGEAETENLTFQNVQHKS